MSNVSLINGHIDGANTCVICGRDIPEGSQVCVICGRETESGENKVYDAIVDYINKHQYPPTVRDLCKLTGYKSTSTIFAKLKALEEKGCIELDINVSRGIKVKARTHYDRIKSMSVDNLASKIVEIIDCKMCPVKNTCEVWESCEHQIIKWLESEVTE